MENTFGNVFYIIKGQYRRVAPSVVVPASGKREEITVFLGGYDPENPNTHEWYMLMDSDTHTVHTASADILTVLAGLYNAITRYHTRAKMVSVTREHMTATSYAQETTDLEVYKKYGDYYKDLCAMVAERACNDLPAGAGQERNLIRKRAVQRAIESLDPRQAVTEVYDEWRKTRALSAHKNTRAANEGMTVQVSENCLKSSCLRKRGTGGLLKSSHLLR